jgi:hypothetical protein
VAPQVEVEERHQGEQVADVQRVRGRIDAGVHGLASAREGVLELLRSSLCVSGAQSEERGGAPGDLGNEPATLEVVEQTDMERPFPVARTALDEARYA